MTKGPTESNRRVLVTGATGGIGRAVARALHRRGARVLAQGRNEARLRELEAEGLLTVAVDLGQADGPMRLVTEAVKQLSKIDDIVQCAGIVRYEAPGSWSTESYEAQFGLNIRAPLFVIHAAIPHLSNGAAIVNIASTLAQRPAPATAVYGASKAALIAASRALALELAPAVRVNVVAPGVIDTEMVRAPRPGARSFEELRPQLVDLHPLHRIGTPEEVADAVLYLLDAQWTTGSVLTLDGGLTL
ncbi:MAG: SDR family oxidoreductase [Myxococcota bacterium]